MRREHLAPAVGALAHQARGRVLADDQVEVGVIGHAVALVRRPHDLAHAAALVPAAAHVGRHVGEQQIVIDRVPDRPFGEGEAGAELADRRIDVDQMLEFANAARCGSSADSARSRREPVALRQRLHDRARAPNRAGGRPPGRARSSPAGRAPAADSARSTSSFLICAFSSRLVTP